MFVTILHYQKPYDEVQVFVGEHRKYLDTKYQTGKCIVSGPKSDKTGGFILFAVKTRSEVEAIIKEDPFYTNGIAEYEILEFDPVKYDQRFAELYL